ncbi:unnamed protein product [Rangifer tarandus platyrhynchus]|uniref:Uncharacterized protein n=1 Tax=Rangifer tarandus platyrhynchus TaxID=3082113 RepID=A0ABN8YW91_RANTA|nr:unnamed protein product [Rangifer tarandus platyrhynchus]
MIGAARLGEARAYFPTPDRPAEMAALGPVSALGLNAFPSAAEHTNSENQKAVSYQLQERQEDGRQQGPPARRLSAPALGEQSFLRRNFFHFLPQAKPRHSLAVPEEAAQRGRSSRAPAEVCKARLCHVLPAGTWASHQGPLGLSLFLLWAYEKSSQKESEDRDTERPWMNVELLSSGDAERLETYIISLDRHQALSLPVRHCCAFRGTGRPGSRPVPKRRSETASGAGVPLWHHRRQWNNFAAKQKPQNPSGNSLYEGRKRGRKKTRPGGRSHVRPARLSFAPPPPKVGGRRPRSPRPRPFPAAA